MDNRRTSLVEEIHQLELVECALKHRIKSHVSDGPGATMLGGIFCFLTGLYFIANAEPEAVSGAPMFITVCGFLLGAGGFIKRKDDKQSLAALNFELDELYTTLHEKRMESRSLDHNNR